MSIGNFMDPISSFALSNPRYNVIIFETASEWSVYITESEDQGPIIYPCYYFAISVSHNAFDSVNYTSYAERVEYIKKEILSCENDLIQHYQEYRKLHVAAVRMYESFGDSVNDYFGSEIIPAI